MANKTILITGANGEVGQGLVDKLKDEKNNTIIGLDLTNNICKNKIDNFIIGSILDKNLIKNIFKK